MKPAIIVHGGAWRIPDDEHEAHKNGCRLAVLAGYQILAEGGSALDAVEKAVMLLEDDPTFDAGTGSHLNRAGFVQLDAGMMDGATLQVGAVAAVERVKNPIRLARCLLAGKYNMIVGEGAHEWAQQCGIPLIDPAELIVPREQARYESYRQTGPPGDQQTFDRPHDTVGAVAIDRAGNLATATSTGGTLFKPVGRVGDSPLPGCGFYADNQTAAVSCTGHGEPIIRLQLARTVADLTVRLRDQAPLPDGHLFSAPAEAAIRLLADRVQGQGGLIMIDRLGHIGLAYNTPHLARAFLGKGMPEPVVDI